MTEDALMKRLDKMANRWNAGIKRMAGAFERIATVFEELDSRGRVTKGRKRRALKPVKRK